MSLGFRNRRPSRILAALCLLLFVPAASACFGEFALVRKVYRWNKQVDEDKWVRWLVFLALNFIPVYGFSAWIDALVLNSIEFWTGENPAYARVGTVRVAHGPNGEIATTRVVSEDVLEVHVVARDGNARSFRFVKEADGVAARSLDGELLARVSPVEGRPVFERY